MPPVEPLIVFCNPGDRRSEGIQQARSRLGMPPAVLIPYAGLLQGQPLADLLEQTGYRLDMLPVREQPLGGVSGQAGQRVDAMQVLDALQGQAKVNSPAPDRLPELTELAAQGRDISRLAMPAASAPAAPAPDTAPPLLRLESPGGSFETERALIALGAPDAPDADDSLHPYGGQPDLRPLSFKTAGALKDMPGVLHHPSQWFRGYCRLLARIQREAAQLLPSARWTNHPGEIAAMTDKRRTQQILAAAGVPIPRPLRSSSGQAPVDYASLRGLMLSQRMHRVFIKLASGSAASGVIAYQLHPATGAEVAVTTIGVESYITRPRCIIIPASCGAIRTLRSSPESSIGSTATAPMPSSGFRSPARAGNRSISASWLLPVWPATRLHG